MYQKSESPGGGPGLTKNTLSGELDNHLSPTELFSQPDSHCEICRGPADGDVCSPCKVWNFQLHALEIVLRARRAAKVTS